MKNLNVKNLLILISFMFLGFTINAQTKYTIPSGAEFIVAGTSSLHDWTMTSKSATGTANIVMENNELKSIDNVFVTLKAESLKSGKGGMDDNAYKALDTKKNPDIKFTLDRVKSIEKKGDHFLINAEGKVTIAGQTKTMAIQSKAYPEGKGLRVTGNKTFKMTEFGVKPPTALMGTIKTGDEITVSYNITFKTN